MEDRVVRAGGPEHVDGICAIEWMPQYRLVIGAWPPEQHLALLAGADARYLVAVDEAGAVDGFAILKGLASEHRSVELARIAVREPNRGVGRVLFREAIRAAFDDHGAHRLWLDVYEGNAHAQHVYRRAGFQVDGVFRESIRIDGAYHSMLLMSMLEGEYRAAGQGSGS